MTPEQQRIAIAEACGRVRRKDGLWFPEGSTVGSQGIPDYPGDLNAMHEAEKMDVLNPVSYREHLSTLYGRATARWDFERATASQRAEAFLRTIDKWEGEP